MRLSGVEKSILLQVYFMSQDGKPITEGDSSVTGTTGNTGMIRNDLVSKGLLMKEEGCYFVTEYGLRLISAIGVEIFAQADAA